MKNLSRRVAALEATTGTTEYRAFFQCLDDQRLYAETLEGPTFTRSQIDTISRAGVQVITVEYVNDWRGDETIATR